MVKIVYYLGMWALLLSRYDLKCMLIQIESKTCKAFDDQHIYVFVILTNNIIII